MQQISRPKHKSYDPFRRSQMTECLHITLIYFLPHVVVGKVCVPVAAPVQPLSYLFLQGVDAGQMPSKIEFSSNTNPFDPKADRFVVADTALFKPCVGRLMYDRGCDPFERCGFRSDDTLVKQAGVQGMQIAAGSVRNQPHPNSR